MSKRDFEKAALIAQCAAKTGDKGNENAVVTDAFVELFRGEAGGRFDEARFRAACCPGANVRARPKK